MFRVGSGEGYYGDDVMRALPMLQRQAVDALAFEALSELTLAILRRQAQRDPSKGYTRDLATIAKHLLPLAARDGVPILTNGGGLNPAGGAEEVAAIAAAKGLTECSIAIVTGDDLLERREELLPQFAGDELVSANVYLGAEALVRALAERVAVVVTGRVADPSLYLAPLIAHFNWAWDDWDRLACGTICGHLLECTAQVTGGNSLASLDALEGGDLANLGYPIAEVEEDGSFVVTKLGDAPGLVNEQTVREQLLYEIHDPSAYVTPDVVVDLRETRVEQVGRNRVRVSGVKGHPRPDKLKVVGAVACGYARELIFRVGAPRARQKAEQLEAMLLAAWRGIELERTFFERLGGENEIVVRAAYAARDRDALEKATRRALALGLSGPAGIATLPASIGAPERPLFELRTALVDRDRIEPHLAFVKAGEVSGARR